MIGCVGNDEPGRILLSALADESVVIDHVRTVAEPTGTAFVLVESGGENQIVVSSGANQRVDVEPASLCGVDAVMCQLEVPQEAVRNASRLTDAYFCLNAAPAHQLSDELIKRADLIIVNETEHALIRGLESCKLTAVTLGPQGAVLLRFGTEVARASSPKVDAVDTIAAGDAFCAAMVIGLVTGASEQDALDNACVAGSMAASRPGSQTSLPDRSELELW